MVMAARLLVTPGQQTLGFGHIAVQITELLAVDFDFGEENFPFVTLFFHFVLLLFPPLRAAAIRSQFGVCVLPTLALRDH